MDSLYLLQGCEDEPSNPVKGPFQLRKIQCTISKWACFKKNGKLDLRYHPFFDENYNVRKDTVEPTFLQRGGVPLWWWKIDAFIGVSIGLSFVQSQGFVPAPFDSTVFNLTGMFIFGAFFFARLTFLYGRVSGAADQAFAAEDGAVSLSQHMSSLLTPDELENFDNIQIKFTRWDVESCSTYIEPVSARDLYCETAYIAAALGYAMVFSFREVGVVAERLPMHETSRRELAYRVGATNEDHLGVMLQMLEERLMAMVGAGLYKRPLRELTGQVDALNSIFAAISKIEIVMPGALLNAFLTFWLYVWLVFLVWIFPFGQVTNIIIASLVQIVAVGTLDFLEAEGLPFDNTETNPYSTVPVQDIKHSLAISALGASLSVFDKVDAFNRTAPEVVQSESMPIAFSPSTTNQITIVNSGKGNNYSRFP
jgi:hypothetical protein